MSYLETIKSKIGEQAYLRLKEAAEIEVALAKQMPLADEFGQKNYYRPGAPPSGFEGGSWVGLFFCSTWTSSLQPRGHRQLWRGPEPCSGIQCWLAALRSREGGCYVYHPLRYPAGGSGCLCRRSHRSHRVHQNVSEHAGREPESTTAYSAANPLTAAREQREEPVGKTGRYTSAPHP